MLLSSVPSHFKRRREKLAASDASAAFLFPANFHPFRNPDVEYPFRQESHFYYLTGFEEPESFLFIGPAASKGGSARTVLFVRRRDAEREMWDGERYGVDGAKQVFGADESYPIEELPQKLPELLKNSEKIYYRVGQSPESDARVLAAAETARRAQGRSGRGLLPIVDPNEKLGEMRLFKSAEEVKALRKACEVSAAAHKLAMQEVRPGMNEFEVEALIDYTCRKGGLQRMGYGSIVAGGRNSTCLHYRANNEPLRDGDLLLIDAGGEFDYYTADITRTFPVGRSFSKPQAELYDLVLKSQKECIAMVKPGLKYADIHKRACEVLTDGMLSLGLLKGKRDELISSGAFRRFYPHGTGHWLGMDVHDVGLYMQNGESRKLEAGMCFTIEPGFYVQPGDQDAPEAYRNLGIRIEDDVLVTEQGCEVLTSGAPKERAEIEALKKQ